MNWDAKFTEAGVPAGRVMSVPEILAHPHLVSREFVREFNGDDPTTRQRVTRAGFRFSDADTAPATPAPDVVRQHARASCNARFRRHTDRRTARRRSDLTMTQTFDAATLAADYWSTSIIDIHPGSINVRGFPIQELIGAVSFPQMIWLMLRGELPDKAQAACLKRRSWRRWIMVRTRRPSPSRAWRRVAVCR
jgi:hypothetical protein